MQQGTWPQYLHAMLFAMRMILSHVTGYSPFYLLYGQHPVFSPYVKEITWQTLDWHQVRTHEELGTIGARQILCWDASLEDAHNCLHALHRKAIKDQAKHHHYCFDFTDYEEGMYVWLRESCLNKIKGGKGEWTYAGLYIIHEKGDKELFMLRKLSGAVLQGHINIRQL
ncbi:hypothetical protein C8Q80DRAFT_1112381 [Daedaleopsis nitida]|nr:hypothetical protein C8Q80DRAFT_1112381 [Daedaleopsis nitida]